MNAPGTLPAPSPTRPDCDRCLAAMSPSGWMPRPDGRGGLRRLTVYRCDGCGRIYDELSSYRDTTGGL